MRNKLSLFGLIGITIAFFGSIRSVPTLASTGWTQIFYILMAAVLFALPIALMSAELSTMWPEHGGPQVWVKNALGEKWGFVTSWLLWVQMFFGMVMVSSTVSILLGYTLDVNALKTNNLVVMAVILITYWAITLLSLKFDMLKIVGSWGAILGVYIPFIIFVILGGMFFFNHGIDPNGYLGGFEASKLLPDFAHPGTWPTLVGIIFIFAGVEMSSIHVNEIDNPKKNYPIGVLISVILVVIFNLMAGLSAANAVPAGKMELANIMQQFEIFTSDIGLPHIVNNGIALLILLGVLAQLSAWVLGPSKTMLQVANDGGLPPIFRKTNKKGDPITLVLIQASVISVIALIYGIVPNVSEAFLIITITTTILYCIVYILISIAAIKLRFSMPTKERSFRLGSKGNGLMWLVAGISILINIVTIGISLIPPSVVVQGQHGLYIGFQIVSVIVMVGLALLIYKLKKPEWKNSIKDNDIQEG